MSKVERKEYKETKILRTVSPVRNFRSSQQDLAQFDSNLDYLLEDLQNSVSRPGSSLDQHSANNQYSSRDTVSKALSTLDSVSHVRSNSLNRISNVKSSNPVTEYSSDDAFSFTSPDGRERVHGYKKEKFMYKSSSGGGLPIDTDIAPERKRMQNSINQLDSLLDDLQQVKKSSYSDRDSYNTIGTDPSAHNISSKRSVNRELHYGDTPRSSSRSRTLERTEKESSYKRDLQYTPTGEGTYGDLRPLHSTSPSPSSRTSTLTKQTKVSNVHQYPVKVVETVAPEIDSEVLAHLDPNLHPPGNTKVTTTIKTYTYEIPGSGDYPTHIISPDTVDTQHYVYSPNDSATTPSRSFVYNKLENKENTLYQRQEPAWQDVNIKKSYKESVSDKVNYNIQPYQKPAPPGGHTVIKETVTTRNYQPEYNPELYPPGPNQMYIYNESTTTKNIQNGYPSPPPPPQPQPPRQETYIINKETSNIINNNKNQPPLSYSDRGYPVYNPPQDNTAYVVRKETHTTTTNNNAYKNGGFPNRVRPISPTSDVETFDPNKPPYGGRNQPPPVNIQYSYKSSNTTQNRYHGNYPNEDESMPLLPKKFPTDDAEGGPPRKLDELMANIGHEPPNSPLNAGFNAHEQDLAHQKKIETLKRQQEVVDDEQQKKEAVSKTKNVSGPPVYYPPGHELFAHKEEGGGGWRAEGAYQKASGKYMYEAESGEKTKMKTKTAVVPVCLPLCCGLPCTLL